MLSLKHRILAKCKKTKKTKPTTSSPQKYNFLELPAEVRLAVYNSIVAEGFLPLTHYRDYIGLFLSCKQFNAEMEHEALQAMRRFNERYAANWSLELRTLVMLSLSQPVNFGSLMHVTISIADICRFNKKTLESVVQAISPLLDLHLSSLTIGLVDTTHALGYSDLIDILGLKGLRRAMDAGRWVFNGPGAELPSPEDYYSIRTAYSDVVPLIAKLSCLIAPGICAHHGSDNHWCLYKGSAHEPRTKPCNVRKIIFRMMKLHEEQKCTHCGKLPHQVYFGSSKWTGWCPEGEYKHLAANGWSAYLANEKGRFSLPFSKKDPAIVVWHQQGKH